MGSSQSSKPLMLSPVEKLKNGNGRAMRNGNGTKGKAIPGNIVENVERGRKKVSSSNGDRDSNGGNVYKKNELKEDELVNGWPKWLVENVPTDVLKNIVPKSADSYSKIDKVDPLTLF